MRKTGVLLVNLGTPSFPTIKSVRSYLKSFLSDPRVLDVPSICRWLLLTTYILRVRPKRTLEAYLKVWTEQGSPLLVYSQALAAGLAERLGDAYEVKLGMRYGLPRLIDALKALEHCDKILVLPLFPQYASATTGSVFEALMRELKCRVNFPSIQIIHQFYTNPGFIQAYSHLIKQKWESVSDRKRIMLFSYHSLPVRHIKKSGCRYNCQSARTCPAISAENKYCYRAQCYETTRLLKQALQLETDDYLVTFQSRLGRTPWVGPYTDACLEGLRKRGINTVVAVSPSFIADCLETLEEMGIRMREQWLALGGKDWIQVPCLNAHPIWMHALEKMVKNHTA